MQSQQKRLKWSRGETAEALEERTDTGITSASVELMENCIPDIYGNISRRPALKLLSGNYAFTEDPYMQVIPFYITETDYILVAIHYTGAPEFIRVTDGVMVAYQSSSALTYPTTRQVQAYGFGYMYKPISYAQQNNYMVIADANNLWKLSFTFGTGSTFTPVIEVCKFTAGWYAPNGTQTKTVSASQLPGLNFSGKFSNYTYTYNDGSSTVFSWTNTGVPAYPLYSGTWTATTETWYYGEYTGYSIAIIDDTAPTDATYLTWNMTNGQEYKDGDIVAESGNYKVKIHIFLENSVLKVGFIGYINDVQRTSRYISSSFMNLKQSPSLEDIQEEIPNGSIIQMPNIGCYLRVEGFDIGSGDFYLYYNNTVFDSVGFGNQGQVTPPSTGLVAWFDFVLNDPDPDNNGGFLYKYDNGTLVSTLRVLINDKIAVKCSQSSTGFYQCYFYNSGGYQFSGWTEAAKNKFNAWVYGSLLTPVADENATDTSVTVEYGYISLTPTSWNLSANYPHPRKLVFNGQRLWAGGWDTQYSVDQYSIVIGSQIARYTDFKNDYNQENEPITLDILTKYKEKIFHLIDYNGLKIMTDSYEYAYDGTNGVVKQSANGSFEYCEPIVFDSLCLYVDSTGQQVKAMQYEFQSNIFNSSTINQVAPHDLVWYPWNMAQYEDKYNSTGKYLFLVNREDANARVAVCNFVPSNQANIWSRWTVPTISYASVSGSIVHSVVNLKGNTLFMIRLNTQQTSYIANVVPAILDFDANTDFESAVYTTGGVNYFCPKINDYSQRLTACNTQVAVYANGVFQWLDTTTSTGALTKSIAGLTNVTVGLPINSTIRSHPIDVGGKTKSIKKRIGKARMSVHGTDAGVLTINGKTGYMNPAKDEIAFYGVTGMKNEIKYTITNKNGGMFHLESLLMNIEYGTLDS